jgi:hypothetical protein
MGSDTTPYLRTPDTGHIREPTGHEANLTHLKHQSGIHLGIRGDNLVRGA